MKPNYAYWDKIQVEIKELMEKHNCDENTAIKIWNKEQYDKNSENWEKYQKEVGELPENEKLKLKELAMRYGGRK